MSKVEEIKTEFVVGAHIVGRALTDTEVETLTEIMQSHMDKATTFGTQSQNLIGDIQRQTHFLSHHLFPRIGAIAYPSTMEGMFDEASDQVNELALLLERWGKILRRLDNEYTLMIDNIKEFHGNLDKKPTEGGNGNVTDS